MPIRAGTARSVVLYMKMGMSVEDARAEIGQEVEGVATAAGAFVTLLPGPTLVAIARWIYVEPDRYRVSRASPPRDGASGSTSA